MKIYDDITGYKMIQSSIIGDKNRRDMERIQE